ncbi:MAG: hypothetical protein P1U39_08115 [Legionellaceae bacterium]|nr:hypothetical protein [Legionellaceae bacterium]
MKRLIDAIFDKLENQYTKAVITDLVKEHLAIYPSHWPIIMYDERLCENIASYYYTQLQQSTAEAINISAMINDFTSASAFQSILNSTQNPEDSNYHIKKRYDTLHPESIEINGEASTSDCIYLEPSQMDSTQHVYRFSKNPSIQQEQQLQIQHQHAHQVQNQTEQQQQTELQVNDTFPPYKKRESALITRDNIEEQFRPYWEYLCQRNAALPGWRSINPEESLSDVLTQFLGSAADANFVAAAIEPEALCYLMQRAPQFLNGLVYDEPPAGIYFQRSTSSPHRLILCFDKAQEKLNPERALKPARLPKELPDEQQAQTLDKKWAKQQGMNEACADYLFSSADLFTERNTESLRQLLYALDKKQGSDRWIALVNLMWTNSTPDNFMHWKSAVLDASMHWAECITADENLAVRLSLNALRNRPNFQVLWWKTLNVHNHTCGYTSYAQVWHSFNRWMSLIEKYHLESHVNIDLFDTLFDASISQNKSFNARVFFDRMTWVLERSQRKLVSSEHNPENTPSLEHDMLSPLEIQAHILNHVHQIDWSHDGFYYASRYNQYSAWREDCCFSKFKHGDTVDTHRALATYEPINQHETFYSIKTLARRFANLHLKLTPSEWTRFNEILDHLAPDLYFEPQTYDLIVTQEEPDAENTAYQRSTFILSPTDVYFYSHLEKRLQVMAHIPNFAEEMRDIYQPSASNLSNLSEEAIQPLIVDHGHPLHRHITLTVGLWIRCLAHGIDRHSLSDRSKALPERLKLSRNQQEQYALFFIANLLPLQGPFNSGDFLWSYYDIERLYNMLSKLERHRLHSFNPTRAFPWINSLGRVMNCLQDRSSTPDIDSMYFDYDKPYLTLYPWLYNKIAVRNDTCSVDIRKFLMNPAEALGETTDEAKQSLRRFEQQLQSINTPNPTYLPDPHALEQAYRNIHQHGEQAREDIIATWIARGCPITLQFAASVPMQLESELFDYAIQTLNTRLSLQFRETNRQLFLKLLPSLAYNQTNEDAKQTLLDFIEALTALDRNDSYDELGTLLRMLMRVTQHQESEHNYYSIENLTQLIIALTDETKPLFPLNLLETIIKQEANISHSSLLNRDLTQLKSNLSSEIRSIYQLAGKAHLPNQVKINLAKLAYKNIDLMQYLLTQWGNTLPPNVSLDYLIHVTHLALNREHITQEVIEQLTYGLHEDTPSYWLTRQQTLASILDSGQLSWDDFNTYFSRVDDRSTKNQAIQAILLQAMLHDRDWKTSFHAVDTALQTWPERELIQLAEYCNKKPKPRMADLATLVTPEEKNTAKLIHIYETQIQTLNKRDLSLTQENADDITRILGGMKRKDGTPISTEEKKALLQLFFYTNAYALTLQDLSERELVNQLHAEANACRRSERAPSPEAQARILACQREILVRKSGKWCNRMQMIDLLYSAMHNEDGLLHQVRTGGGKSIIALIRMSYRALMGEVIDFYSAKTSLAARDHTAYDHVLDAIGIRHCYVDPSMDVDDIHYQAAANGIGAINFGTSGSFNLAENRWKQQGLLPRNYDSKNRGAYVDEFHNVCNDTTQCNSPDDSTTSTDAFNPDVWIYEVAYDYFLAHQERFKTNDWSFDNETDLPGLERALKERELALFSQRSTRLQNYVCRGEESQESDIQKRDRTLAKLLRAAYTAHFLKHDAKAGFSIWHNVEKRIGGVDGETLTVSAAKVLIDSQVSEGSTFSDLVHQLLHVRMNKEGLERGQDPDFFVDPVQTISLSQNMLDRLRSYKNRGAKIEGCTATSGREWLDLRFYEENFGINHVLKLPGEKPLRTTVYPPMFCQDKEAMAEALSQITQLNAAQPILVLCPDDASVKIFSNALNTSDTTSTVIEDTNDGQRTENDVIRMAHGDRKVSDPGAITLSARMGQGTDIELSPDLYDSGLFVVTLGSRERFSHKQGHGRQGRMGFAGAVQDIYDITEIEAQWRLYQERYSELLDLAMDWENRHLQEKIAKHQNRTNKWDWVESNPEAKIYYLKNRATALLAEHSVRQEKATSLAKDRFFNELSCYVGDCFNQASDEDTRKNLKAVWLKNREAMEALWSEHQASFPDYLDAVQPQLRDLGVLFRGINRCYSPPAERDVLEHFEAQLHHELSKPARDLTEAARVTDPALPAIQGWLRVVQQKLRPNARTTMFGHNDIDINQFFEKLSSAPQFWLDFFSSAALDPAAGLVSCAAWNHIISDEDHLDAYQTLLPQFFEQFHGIEDVDLFNEGVLLLKHQVNQRCDHDKIMYQLSMLSHVVRIFDDNPSPQHKQLLNLIRDIIISLPLRDEIYPQFFLVLTTVLQQEPYWLDNNEQLYDKLNYIFTKNQAISTLFIDKIIDDVTLSPVLEQVFSHLDTNQTRLEQMITYLSKHSEDVSLSPKIIASIFALCLSDEDNALPPEIVCIPHDVEQTCLDTFWAFLVKRQPIDQAELNQVLSWLQSSELPTSELNSIIDALDMLPASMPFSYLALHVSSHAGMNPSALIDVIAKTYKIITDLEAMDDAQFDRYMASSDNRLHITEALKHHADFLPDAIRAQCYRYYRRHLEAIAFNIDDRIQTIGQYDAVYQQAYQDVQTFLDVIQGINPEHASASQETLSDIQNQHKALFKAQEKRYEGFFWSCNRQRITQARTLFTALGNITTGNKKEYYQQVMNTLTDTQNTIFTGDQSYYFYASNKKGYSRLHHICTELFLTVARDCLLDPELSTEDKLIVQEQYKTQVQQHVTLLSQQIDNTAFANDLNTWASSNDSNDSMERLATIMARYPKNSISPKLHYLYNSLEIMVHEASNVIATQSWQSMG